ncbi:hypothetical protein BP00DRAFT_425329 [Aspergillus indologenus CBS 114.80]|uniref:F-box domain-containing protein n=1 Tax=Aspergillus indologenus CBS 114.80 TaxID=1450541 RepID=A0A2V5I5C6_9EURO|nr:hypothetical protein BP00DRAFT_425329 [Aspergillus indologenus CBS 114.80]
MAVAMEHVLALPELLELILFSLDERTLLTSAQRVSTHWHGTIQKCAALQEKLFFKPCRRRRRRTASDPENNTRSDSSPTQQPTLINPLLTAAFPVFFPPRPWRYGVCGLDFVTDPAKRAAFLRPEASWRSMLVQQPPAYSLGLLQHQHHTAYYGSYEMMKSHDGLRMEALFELLFFHPDLTSQDSLPHDIIWWGECADPFLRLMIAPWAALDGVEQPDVLVCMLNFVRDEWDIDEDGDDYEEEEEEDGDSEGDHEDEDDIVRSETRTPGLQPDVLGPGSDREGDDYRDVMDAVQSEDRAPELDSDSDSEDEGYQSVVNSIQSGYRALGLEPKILREPEWERQTIEYSGSWH